MGYSVSFATIHRIQHGKGAIRENIRITGNTGLFPKSSSAANVDVVQNIHNMIKLVNPQTQREMTPKCGVSLGTENRIISKYLKAKCNV